MCNCRIPWQVRPLIARYYLGPEVVYFGEGNIKTKLPDPLFVDEEPAYEARRVPPGQCPVHDGFKPGPLDWKSLEVIEYEQKWYL